MRDNYEKLKRLYSVNLTFHRDHIDMFEGDTHSMRVIRNDLQQQLRVMNLQKNLDKEEFEKLLQIANQHTVVVDTEEEDESFSHLPRHKMSKQNIRAESSSKAGGQLANSTELPGHDHATTVMSKISCCVSEILPPTHIDEEEVVQRTETPETTDDDKVSMTRVMFKSIMTKAIEDQKTLANATSAEAVKVSFMKGVKHVSELPTQPLHSSSMEPETVSDTVEESPVIPSEETELHVVHLIRPGIGNAMEPSVVKLAKFVQSAEKLPVFSC